ncbi:MAG: hypothetical protein ISR69_05875 [Gammaproteobacteria bacterium]|nr:hypothetical protein [Candidatus Brocadiales bacterium]MBL7003534.1 hypothetical protein [Gammaproteobacteria bacterium]
MNDLISTTYPNGKFASQIMCNEDKTDGFRVHWYESGQMKSAGEYKYGKPDGLLTAWYENGNKSAEINYSKGVKDGRLVIWHKDGSKRSEVIYSSGRMNSLWVSWYENGQMQKAVLFKDKKKSSKTLWHKSGGLKLQEAYESSHRTCHELPEIDWDSYPYNSFMDEPFTIDGKPEKINPYAVSKLFETSWYKNGNIKKEWAYYGYQNIDTEWYENGQMKYINSYASGSQHIAWHENGQKSYMESTIKDGYDIAWNDNGIKEYEFKCLSSSEDDSTHLEWIFYKQDVVKLCTIRHTIDFENEHDCWYFYDDKKNQVYEYNCAFSYIEDSIARDQLWDFWMNLKNDKLLKILINIEAHKNLIV